MFNITLLFLVPLGVLAVNILMIVTALIIRDDNEKPLAQPPDMDHLDHDTRPVFLYRDTIWHPGPDPEDLE